METEGMNFEEEVIKMEVGIKLYMPEKFPFVDVEIDHATDGEYCWSAKRRSGAGHAFPMKNSNYVKTFKTLNGARRSLLRFILKHVW